MYQLDSLWRWNWRKQLDFLAHGFPISDVQNWLWFVHLALLHWDSPKVKGCSGQLSTCLGWRVMSMYCMFSYKGSPCSRRNVSGHLWENFLWVKKYPLFWINTHQVTLESASSWASVWLEMIPLLLQNYFPTSKTSVNIIYCEDW